MARTTPETKIKDAILDWCNASREGGLPILAFRRDSATINYRRGLPDIFVVYKNIHIEVEVKTPEGELSIDQIKWGERFRRMGTPYLVARSLTDFIDALNNDDFLNPSKYPPDIN